MKQLLTRTIFILSFLFGLISFDAIAQVVTANSSGSLKSAPNYSSFTDAVHQLPGEAVIANKNFEKHPELGLLFAEAPCNDCYELLGRRTENSKTFIKTGTNGSDIMQQTGSGPLHYIGANGEWRTIQARLRPEAQPGIFSASEQEAPVTINTTGHFSSIGQQNKAIQFNRNLELVYRRIDGSEQLLGGADYSHYTAGDDGVYITNAWEGVDIEMRVIRGAIKTNFIINHSMPAYAAGSLLVRDHMLLEDGMELVVPGDNKQHYKGDIEVKKGAQRVYTISTAVAFEREAGRNTLKSLAYSINGNDVDIALPGDFLNRPASAYPVIIDPLVSFATTTSVTGSTYSPSWSSGCVYSNAATVPAKVTVTDIQFTFQYIASGGALTNNGAYDFRLGTCRSPAPSSLYWNCSSGLPGTCDAIGATIFAGQISPCLGPAQCTPYDLNLTMDFYQNFASASSCAPMYISAGTPLTITVFGHTVEANAVTAVPSSVCQGQSTVLTASSSYGVPPYIYSWSPVLASTSTVSVTPLTTTTYSVTVTDACGSTSTASKTINVNPVTAITGATTICSGGSSALMCLPMGGTWSSGSVSVAGIGATSGIVTGGALGTATISYTSPMGCISATPVNVIPPVAPVVGYLVVCSGSTTTLSNATPGGVWSSAAPAVGTVGSTSGIAMGVSSGTATISYTTTGAGCYSTATLTVNPLAPITGSLSICVGGTTTLADAVSGGSWSSGSPAVATINPATGVATGVSAGTAMITYTTPAGCKATASLVVNLLSPVTGVTNACQGYTTTLSDAAGGGVWSSSNPSIASVGSVTGVVSGVSGGTAIITYTIPPGCFTTAAVTINPISAISGTTSVCVGGTTILSNAAGSGTWVSSNPSVAAIGLSSGIVTGLTVGSSNITFTSAAGCSASTVVNVGLPTSITGASVVCEGSSILLSNATTGGSWLSSNISVATIGASSGILTGVSGGAVTISYITPSGCAVTTSVTVNANPAITGAFMLCTGGATTLYSAVSGGTWNSVSGSVAAIGASSGVVTALSTGTTVISYTTPAGCISSNTLTVSIPSAITGVPSVCQGSTTILSNATPGGVWSSSNTSVAAVGASSGVVNGLSGGTAVISYATAGGCNATVVVTVNAVAPITGITGAICAGSSITLGNTVSGGTWNSVNPTVAAVGATTGVVTGLMSGTAGIEYTTAAGCVSSATVVVNASPTAISGGTLVCATTTLSNGVIGGTWSSSNTSIAVVGPSTGIVTGILPGTVTITYTLPGGCFSTVVVTVDPLTGISGTPSVCQGTTTALSYPQPGGTWISLNPAVATVDASGIVSGIAPGTAIIRYTTPTGCAASQAVTVYARQPIVGPSIVCRGNTITLTNTVAGGAWASSLSAVASVSASGVVTGNSSGTAVITYTTPAGCFTISEITVNPLSPIVGTNRLCAGSTSILTNATTGGTWSSTASTVATVDISSGVVTGVVAGTTIIKYTTALGCVANLAFTVNPLPSAIGGITKVCAGSTTILTNTLAGGAWTSSTPGVASIGVGTGIVNGISAGTANITYTSAAGCTVSAIVTVNPLPMPITGITTICQGQTSLLGDATPGGTWSSTSPSIASVAGAGGLVSGALPGSAIIKYTTPDGCIASTPFIVNAAPSAITGTMVVCEGANTTLANALPGGTWASADLSVATVGYSTGILTGVSAGNTMVTYTTGAGCFTFAEVTVNPTPRITSVTFSNPTTCINADGTIKLSGLIPAQPYTVSYTTASGPVTVVLTTDGTGSALITTLAAGSYSNFSVTNFHGCTSPVWAGPVVLTLPPAPPIPIVGTNSPVCDGDMLYLTAANSVVGVTYLWTGPGGYSSTTQNPVFSPATLTHTGSYTVTATKLGCVSPAASIGVVVHPIPQISSFAGVPPTTCEGINGYVTLKGLVAGLSYVVNYTFNGTPASATIVADVSGNVTISGLASGTYADFNVSSYSCISNSVGPVTLKDPNPPPAPALYSNSPICSGKTLSLDAASAIADITYEWTGPGGFTSNQKNPKIADVSMADSGLYTLTIRHLNCPATKSMNVVVYPPLKLTNISGDKVIPLGSSTTLKAEGAAIYYWAPNDGTLNNNNIDSPVAAPQQTTVYTLRAMNVWGCEDTARITITVDDNINTDVPNAFTPNGDGLNDVFKAANTNYHKLVDFSVYNRWGQLVYHNEYNISEGWDGTFNGVPQDMGVYNYVIILSQPDGKLKTMKGTVALIR